MSSPWLIRTARREQKISSNSVTAMAKSAADVYLDRVQARSAGRDRDLCERDFVFHFQHLAEALRLGQPELFTDYVAWANALFHRLKLPEGSLAQALLSMEKVVSQCLADDLRSQALAIVRTGSNRLPEFPVELPGLIEPDAPHADLARNYLRSLLEGDRHLATRMIMDAIDEAIDLREIYAHVFEPCQREVGRLWQTNRISVAQEHFVTAVTQSIMCQFYPRIFSGPRNGRRMVGACVGGDLHELGLRMVCDFLEMEGWDTWFLGASTPADSVVRMAADRGADIVGISAAMVFNLPAVTDLICCLRSEPRTKNIPILVGGNPFNGAPDLWRTLQADGHARNAREAVCAAASMVVQRCRRTEADG